MIEITCFIGYTIVFTPTNPIRSPPTTSPLAIHNCATKVIEPLFAQTTHNRSHLLCSLFLGKEYVT